MLGQFIKQISQQNKGIFCNGNLEELFLYFHNWNESLENLSMLCWLMISFKPVLTSKEAPPLLLILICLQGRSYTIIYKHRLCWSALVYLHSLWMLEDSWYLFFFIVQNSLCKIGLPASKSYHKITLAILNLLFLYLFHGNRAYLTFTNLQNLKSAHSYVDSTEVYFRNVYSLPENHPITAKLCIHHFLVKAPWAVI